MVLFSHHEGPGGLNSGHPTWQQALYLLSNLVTIPFVNFSPIQMRVVDEQKFCHSPNLFSILM